MTDTAFFTAATFDFLSELAAHNDRAWFQENRRRYETALEEPAQRFILAVGERLARVGPSLRADPRRVGGSMFRIHRDVRFSKDKSPYKTHAGIQFRHAAGKDAHAPGLYVHLEPSGCFVGLGVWRPASAPLGAIRERLAEHPEAWTRAVAALDRGGLELAGESLTRMPRGFDADHPQAADLRRKDFIAVAPLERDRVISADFPETVVKTAEAGVPLLRFLCDALGVAP